MPKVLNDVCVNILRLLNKKTAENRIQERQVVGNGRCIEEGVAHVKFLWKPPEMIKQPGNEECAWQMNGIK